MFKRLLFGTQTSSQNNPQSDLQHRQSSTPANHQSGGRSVSAGNEINAAIKSAINKTMGTVGAIALPPILVGLIVTILLFICTWIIAQSIVQLFGIHRQFLVVCLSLLIGAILGGTARLVWGMSGVAVAIGKALSKLMETAEAANYKKEVVYPRLMLIGAVTGIFTFIILFAFSVLGGSAYYITAQKTSENLFSFNSDAMLNTKGTNFNQAEYEDRSISILPTTGAGRALSGINNAGIKAASPLTASANRSNYTVVSGDTFKKIAQKFNLSTQAIKDANPTHARKKWLNVGDVLVIPN